MGGRAPSLHRESTGSLIIAGRPIATLRVGEVPKPGVHLGCRALLILSLVNTKCGFELMAYHIPMETVLS